jgi:glycosyltransferase involved in cell wall biosynthesis
VTSMATTEPFGHISTEASALGKRVKTVLVIDYFFPPLAGAAVQRTLGFVRYLARFGWQPIVLTVQAGDWNLHDTSLLEKIPESVDVLRTASIEPLRLARRIFTRASAEGNRYSSEPRFRVSALKESIRRLQGLERWVFFPDRRVGWVPFAVARTLRTSRSRAIDLVYSSSAAVSSHVIAYIVKKILGTAWVADFQDPWAEGAASCLFPSPLHASLARRLEGSILRSADHVTVAADPIRRSFEGRNKQIPPGKVTLIPSGYDPAAFAGVRAVRRSKFTITHFGSFYAARSPEPFLEALGQCVQEHPQLSADLEVLFLGTFDPALRAVAVRTIDHWKLHDVVRLEGAVPHAVGVGLLVSSDVLAIIADPGQWARSTVPAKLYEYLAAKRPILALLPDGPAAELLLAAKGGLIVPPDDVRAIKEAIWTFYRRGKEGHLAFPADHSVVEQYTWSALAGRLASVFEEVLHGEALTKGRSAADVHLGNDLLE